MSWVEPLWISKVGHTVLARSMESQIWHQPTSSVELGHSKGTMTTGPDARHFSLSLYATGALQAATLVLELRGSESEEVSFCVIPQEELLGDPVASSTCQFSQPEVVGTYLPGTGILGWGDWCGTLLLRYPFQNCIHVGMGQACSASVPLLTVWMDVVSSFP